VKRIPYVVKLILALIFVPLALIAILMAVVLLHSIINNKCSYNIFDDLPSPMGNLSIVRTEKNCSNDQDTPPMMFALLRSGEQLDEGRVFLTSAGYEGLQSSLSIFPKWIDDHNLIIAAPEGSSLRTMRTEFDGVHIHYVNYPIDSNKVKDEYLRLQVEKRIHFKPKFSIDHGFGGIPGIGCHLTISAHDGEYLDELELDLTARATYAVKARQPPDYNKTVLHEAYSGYDFQIVARDEIERPDKHATGADVIGFTQNDGISMRGVTGWNYPRTKAPSGVPMPKWQFGHNPKNPQDIVTIAKKIQAGTIAIRVGFWLDNKVVVYSGEKPDDQKPIEMFEQCINENQIFDTPRHSTDHYYIVTPSQTK
jgi:hypothetical protein